MTPQPQLDCAAQPVEAALRLARGFANGGRLVAAAPGRVDHAHHIAVEFLHPVIAGARSLPAIATEHPPVAVAPGDMLLVVEPPAETEPPRNGLLVPGQLPEAEVVRTYHLVWELVHIGLEHPGISGGAASSDGDSTGFLYPFLGADEEDEAGLVEALHRSVVAKRTESSELCRTTIAAAAESVSALAELIAAATASGRRLLLAGNGGSATDAARLGRLLRSAGHDPVVLTDNPAVLSALANDLGAAHLFSRQVQALGRRGDVLVCLTTSGASENLLQAVDVARSRGLTTAAIAGYGGGPIGQQGVTDVAIAVESQSVHRIQEAQAALIDELIGALRRRERAA